MINETSDARPTYSGGMPAGLKYRCVLIFGGTFDPPHRAHVELPRAAAAELACDRIVYVPARINPLKVDSDANQPASAHHRLAMLRLALKDVPDVEISTVELEREGPSYTIDTVRVLCSDPDTGYRLLIGADQALDFHRWKQWREIVSLAKPVVMLRPPWSMATFASALRQRYDAVEAQEWESRTLSALPVLDISATEIRHRLASGLAVGDQLPPAVAAYIEEHGLYRGAPA